MTSPLKLTAIIAPALLITATACSSASHTGHAATHSPARPSLSTYAVIPGYPTAPATAQSRNASPSLSRTSQAPPAPASSSKSTASLTASSGTQYTITCFEYNGKVFLPGGAIGGTSIKITKCRIVQYGSSYLAEFRFQALDGYYSGVYGPV